MNKLFKTLFTLFLGILFFIPTFTANSADITTHCVLKNLDDLSDSEYLDRSMTMKIPMYIVPSSSPNYKHKACGPESNRAYKRVSEREYEILWNKHLKKLNRLEQANKTLTQTQQVADSGNFVKDLKELSKLYEEGLLTEEEFTKAKEKLLGTSKKQKVAKKEKKKTKKVAKKEPKKKTKAEITLCEKNNFSLKDITTPVYLAEKNSCYTNSNKISRIGYLLGLG